MDGLGYYVCARCLEADPSRIELTTRNCLQESLHSNEPKVEVVWITARNRLERSSDRLATPPIRPMPRVSFRGEFVLCDRGKRCRGEKCTFPHSAKERDLWNAEKFGSKCMKSNKLFVPLPKLIHFLVYISNPDLGHCRNRRDNLIKAGS